MHRYALTALLSLVAVTSAAFPQSSTPPGAPSLVTLTQMRGRLDSITRRQPFDFSRYQAVGDSVRLAVFNLIERDSLRTGGDFFAASQLVFDPVGFFENRRVEHEMALASMVLGETAALKRVALTWDGLNLSMGLGQRVGSFTRNGVATDMDPVPAPSVVQKVFKDFDAARLRATASSNNAELQTLRDADQADRADPIDQAKMKRMDVQDPKRRARVLELVAAGAPATGRDFQNAATVMQHGSQPNDYRLAHELAVAAFALGDTSSRWLIARSYDRMLLRFGHRQRLATQFRGITLMPIDTVATNDSVRELLGGRKLVDVRRGDHP